VEHQEPQTSTAGDDQGRTMEVLKSHVPLTLLMDLGNAEGPDSARIAQVEGGDADWLPGTGDRSVAQPVAVEPVAAGE
jgi:hypothetical protein